MKLNGRQIATLALLLLFALVAVAPIMLLGSGDRNSGSRDQAYLALEVFARSQAGDRSADVAATQVYPTLTRSTVDGHERFNREGENGTCWELDLTRSDRPYETDAAHCA